MPVIALNLGSSKAGLNSALRAQALDDEATVLSTVSSGFTEVGNGQYLFSYTTVPSGTVAFRFYSTVDGVGNSYFTLALDESATIPASGDPETVAAYLYTRNSSGTIVPTQTVYYQVVGAVEGFGDAWDDEVRSVISDATGLATIEMVVGLFYKYWINDGKYKTVEITDETADPYELPEVRG